MYNVRVGLADGTSSSPDDEDSLNDTHLMFSPDFFAQIYVLIDCSRMIIVCFIAKRCILSYQKGSVMELALNLEGCEVTFQIESSPSPGG